MGCDDFLSAHEGFFDRACSNPKKENSLGMQLLRIFAFIAHIPVSGTFPCILIFEQIPTIRFYLFFMKSFSVCPSAKAVVVKISVWK